MPAPDDNNIPPPPPPPALSTAKTAELAHVLAEIEAEKEKPFEEKWTAEEIKQNVEKWAVEVQPAPVFPDPAPTGFSQNNEEKIILEFFEKHPPRFGRRLLDIGAWDGKGMSNSRALVEKDWNAVLVEAAAGPTVQLMNNCRGFKKVRIVQALIVGQSTPLHHSRLTVLQHTQDAVSTTDPTVFAAWQPVISDYFPLMVPTIRVSELLDAFAGPFDLVSIDTEGETFSIFCDIIERAEISLLVVEHACGGLSQIDQIRAIALAKGYTELAVNQENVIFALEPDGAKQKLASVFQPATQIP